ncbi:MAG: FtsX-like permease family protein, partial [Kangiellaceae bacterium]|nr:FtsX-like permease family protein [Kangiellaceae bacterium]
QLDNTQRITGAESGAPQLGSALGRAKNYLDLSGVLGLLLGGIAIAIAANRYATRHFDHSALLRCMGLRKNQVVWVFTWILLMAGTIGSVLGVVLGYAVNELLVLFLADLLPSKIPQVNAEPLILGFITGLVVLLGFALPALLRIRSIVPMRILRKDIEPMSLSHWFTLSIALFTLSLVLYWYAQNFKLVAAMIIGGSVLTAISLAFAMGLLKLARSFSKKRSIAFKFGVEHLERHRSASLIQISAFGLTLTLILTILLMRNELIEDWKAQLPVDAPNHFMVNILEEEVEPLKAIFAEQDISATEVFPMVRGRITALNDTEPKKFLPEGSRGHNSLRRDLNLTWSAELASSNTIVTGEWNMQQSDEPLISIDDRMANSLGLKVGDSITFDIAGESITASIASTRTIEWDSFQPNFFVIFNDKALADMPATYITSFFLSPDQKVLLNRMVTEFPTVSVIELDLILNEVRKVLDKATLAVEVVLVFVVLAGLAVLLATTRASLDEKLYESAILKTLGANKAFVKKTTLIEYWVLGLLAGLLAAIASEGLAYALYLNVFKIDPIVHWWIWLFAPIFGLLMVVPAGMAGNKRVLKMPPASILNES